MLSLDEAIKHCEEKAKEQDKLATRYEDASGYSRSHIESLKTDESIKCRACASVYRQLAEWLRELREYRDGETAKITEIYTQGYYDGFDDGLKKGREEVRANDIF